MPKKEPAFRPPITCVVCDKELQPCMTDNCQYEVVNGGTVGKIFAPFGSEHDGFIFQIGICDSCAKTKLILLGDYMDTHLDEHIKQRCRSTAETLFDNENKNKSP
ncbi:MAG: hypothetical protein Q7R33_02840 [Nitrosarchaeum sp.]|nr:hypothetical protein [Nitrosarchaeum sp.]